MSISPLDGSRLQTVVKYGENDEAVEGKHKLGEFRDREKMMLKRRRQSDGEEGEVK